MRAWRQPCKSLTLVTVLGQKLGYSGEDGLDRHLMQRAEQAGKPTGGLESIDAQLDAMDATPVAEQLAAEEALCMQILGGAQRDG